MSDNVQARIVCYIVSHVETHGYPPSVRDIATELDLVPSTTQYHLQRMFDQGILKRPPGVPRAITVSEAGMKLARDPLAEL